MITKGRAHYNTTPNLYDFYGLSYDKKPDIPELLKGMTFKCIDTGEVYVWNQETREWIQRTTGRRVNGN